MKVYEFMDWWRGHIIVKDKKTGYVYADTTEQEYGDFDPVLVMYKVESITVSEHNSTVNGRVIAATITVK